jgi:hypothetical protein
MKGRSAMTDEEIARSLSIQPADVQRMGPEWREAMVKLLKRVEELMAWDQGRGPMPKDVLIDGPRRKSR